MDTFDQMPSEGLCRIHMDPEQPVPGIGESGLVGELTDEAIDAFVGARRARSGSPLLLSELRQLGGAFGRPDPNGGALCQIEADFAMFSVGMPMSPEMGEASRPTGQLGEAMQPWRRRAPTSTSPRHPATSTRSCRPRSASAWQVKRRLGPGSLVVANHAVALGQV